MMALMKRRMDSYLIQRRINQNLNKTRGGYSTQNNNQRFENVRSRFNTRDPTLRYARNIYFNDILNIPKNTKKNLERPIEI